tara:strand:+ start:231 stop:572 length:342 start_codon:yes stop_codon:yes gene_type:complete
MKDLIEIWVETLTLFFLAVGFVIAVLLQNAALSYLAILFSGALAGRIFYTKRFKEPVLPFVLIIIGFVVGYLIGGIWISRGLAFVLFALGFLVSYYLHLKKILVIFKSKNFIK